MCIRDRLGVDDVGLGALCRGHRVDDCLDAGQCLFVEGIGVDPVSYTHLEGCQERRRAERQPHGQHCRAVLLFVGQVGVLPRGTGRAQGERRQRQCEDDRKAQDGEIQRAAGVGVNQMCIRDSIKPIRFITGFGVFVALVSFIGVLWAVIEAALGLTVSGWASMTSIICFVSGVQLICLGVIGEYIGKIYLESKHRPRYIISDSTPNFGEIKEDAQ